ncbi:UNKNOWN [Stylonychia lemnae]|uniref:Uncharacterized protein n=1 Tax=Stylonychia lemnae TaxID=5949 RepID=A0A078A157_STYLE|nr:UNKNOWN [Stylonychia lemnae]|eukprot:CDW74514.1 UNKNOWN [Stylonychia lemnae]
MMPSQKIINRDSVEIDISKDLEQLKRIMMSMNINNNDRQQLTNLFCQMATNKEAMYSETLKVQNGLTKLDGITESLLMNQDFLSNIQDETRMIFKYIKDQETEMKENVENVQEALGFATNQNNQGKNIEGDSSRRNGYDSPTFTGSNSNRKKDQSSPRWNIKTESPRNRPQQSFKSQVPQIQLQKASVVNEQSNKVPGGEVLRLTAFLREWDQQELLSNYDIENYANELWMTTKQFEEDLKKHYIVYKNHIQSLDRNHKKREQVLRDKFDFYTEAQERALTQLKMNIGAIKEQYEMQLCDYQSFLFNQHIPFDDINELVRMDNIDTKNDISATDAYIKQLQKCIRSLKLDVKRLETQLIYQKKEIQSNVLKVQSYKEQLGKVQELRNYGLAYQCFGQSTLVQHATERSNNALNFATLNTNNQKNVNADILEGVQLISNETVRQFKQIQMNYKGLETLDGTLKNKDKDKDQIKRLPLQRRQSLLSPGRQSLKRKNTQNLVKIKKSKFQSTLQMPEPEFTVARNEEQSSRLSNQRQQSQASIHSGQQNINHQRSLKRNRYGSNIENSYDKYAIDFEAYKDEDDRLTFRQGNFLIPLIEKALNQNLPKDAQMEIVNQISVEKLIKKINLITKEKIFNTRKSTDKFFYPIHDLIDIVYGNEKNEVIGFQINPKMARLMFIKGLHDECNLRGVETAFFDHFKSKVRDLYLCLNMQMPEDENFKYEKLIDSCDDPQKALELPIENFYATNLKDILDEDDENYHEKKIVLSLEMFLDQLCGKFKDLIQIQYDTQLKAFNQLRDYDRNPANGGDQNPRLNEKFKLQINFDEIFMDEKTLNEMKNTLKRLTNKLSRKKALQQSNEQIEDFDENQNQIDQQQRKDQIVKNENQMVQKYQSLMKPLDEVLASIIEEAQRNGIFIENVSFDQFLAAAVREEDQAYTLETITNFLGQLREIISQNPNFSTILLKGKGKPIFEERRIILSKEEKKNYYAAKIEDLDRLIKKNKPSKSKQSSKQNITQDSGKEKTSTGGAILKGSSLVGEQQKRRLAQNMNLTIQQVSNKPKDKNAEEERKLAIPEKLNPLERKKTILLQQSRKQVNKFLLNNEDQQQTFPSPKKMNESSVDLKLAQNQFGNDDSVKPFTQQRPKRKSILNQSILVNPVFSNFSVLSASYQSTDIQSSNRDHPGLQSGAENQTVISQEAIIDQYQHELTINTKRTDIEVQDKKQKNSGGLNLSQFDFPFQRPKKIDTKAQKEEKPSRRKIPLTLPNSPREDQQQNTSPRRSRKVRNSLILIEDISTELLVPQQLESTFTKQKTIVSPDQSGFFSVRNKKQKLKRKELNANVKIDLGMLTQRIQSTQNNSLSMEFQPQKQQL